MPSTFAHFIQNLSSEDSQSILDKFSSMPQYVLKIKADLENIKQLIPLPDNHWELTIQSADGKFSESSLMSVLLMRELQSCVYLQDVTLRRELQLVRVM